MFWTAIFASFGAIAVLAWIGGALVNRGLKIGDNDPDVPIIPGLHQHDDDGNYHH